MKSALAQKFRISTKTLVTIFIILFVLLSSSAILDFYSRRKMVIESMTHYTQLLTNTIQKSVANSIILNRLLNYYIEEWFTSNLKNLGKLETTRKLDNDFLATYATENKIHHINLYDSNGNREKYSHRERQCLNHPAIIRPILQKENDVSVFGVQPLTDFEEEVYVIAVARPAGGAIVGAMRAQRFAAIQSVIGIERYLNTIASDSAIIYITIQDSSGIIAKTKNFDPTHLLSSQQTVAGKQPEEAFHWEISAYDNRRIFEASAPLTTFHNRYYGTLRVGLDYSPVQKMQRDLLQHILIRLLVLLIIGFTLFFYSISIQNVQILEQEKANITDEVYRLQHNLRHREKMSAIGELAAGIAHEIRNPLGAISMTVQRLSREFGPAKDTDEWQHLLNIIHKEIDHIGSSIKNLLQFSKPTPLQCSQHRIDEIITKIISLYQSKAEEAGIKLKQTGSVATEAFIDPVKIENCLVNLLENALAATPAGGSIEFGLKQRQRIIVITLKDTGIGIPEENLSKIFNLYYTTKPNGTGLGLAHAQQIISEHGGTIHVHSRKNEGTTFTITLPGK